MSEKVCLLMFFISTLFYSVNSSNILFVSCVISPSHYIFNKALAEGLAARGHNITFISADKEENPPDNIHYIHLENLYKHFLNDSEYAAQPDADPMEFIKTPDLLVTIMLYEFGTMLCEATSKSKGLHTIKNYPNDFKFDLVIYDYSFSLCLYGLLHQFNYPPLIGISAFNNPSYTVDILGGDKLGLTVKPYYLFYYDKNMTTYQRLHNGFMNFFDSLYRKYIGMPKYDKYTKAMFGHDIPYIAELEKTMSLALVNIHPALDYYAESLPPNVIQVGGLQIKEPKLVDNDINEFLLKGMKGSILMSFGTNFRSDGLGEERIEIFLETFRQLRDYNFLWKFETSEKLLNIPSNVMIKAWISQNDILAHPSVRGFISHVGLLSTQEATWRGIPIIGIPLFADQHNNLHKLIIAGVALKVDFLTLTVEKLKNAIIEVVENSKYKRNMDVKSKLFRDQKESPLERAVWWCEYVIRNPKISHLKAAEFNLGLLGSHFWDIQLIIIVLLLILAFIVKNIFLKIFKQATRIDDGKKNN